jgi:hypothetical protein
VTDTIPNVIATVSTITDTLRIGDKLIDIDLYVDLANREYYDLRDIEAELTVGDDTPFIPSDSTVTGTSVVTGKWFNPAADYLDQKDQNRNNLYFNLNLHPDVTVGTYYLDLNLTMLNAKTMTTVNAPTTLEVKIYPKIASLRIIDVSVSTGKVSPGKKFTLDITIQNDGGEAAREIYIEFLEAYVGSGSFIESSEHINPTGARYPFSSEVMKAYIGEILPASTGQATFTVIGDLNIYPGVTYFQNIQFDYKDSTGVDHASTDVAPIRTDSDITAKVGGENYVWDTDREAWIHEDELAAEEIIDYAPYWITAIVIIWFITFLVAYLFIIKPKYKRDQMEHGEGGDEEPKAKELHDAEEELDEPSHEPEEPEDEQDIVDYSTPPPPPPPPAAASAPLALPPAKKTGDTKETSDEPSSEESNDKAEDSDNLTKKGPKKED